jgi:hypothetical protein
LSEFPSKQLQTVFVNGVNTYEAIPPFILADSTYPNSKHLVTTFKTTECRNPVTAKLNKKLGGARYHVENAFGILKNRFQIFERPLQCAKDDLSFAIELMTACFVLHNFLIDVKDNHDDTEWVRRVGGNQATAQRDLEVEEEEPEPNDEGLDDTRNILLRHMRWLYDEDTDEDTDDD